MEQNRALNDWQKINRDLTRFQSITILLSIVLTIMVLGTVINFYPDPIVIFQGNETRKFYGAQATKISLNNEDVKTFVEEFIRLRFEVGEEGASKVIKDITPLSTPGFLKVLRVSGDIQQYVGRVNVKVSDKEVVATFDKIISLNGINLVVTSEAKIILVKDHASRWNPYGILVHGVIEHELK